MPGSRSHYRKPGIAKSLHEKFFNKRIKFLVTGYILHAEFQGSKSIPLS